MNLKILKFEFTYYYNGRETHFMDFEEPSEAITAFKERHYIMQSWRIMLILEHELEMRIDIDEFNDLNDNWK